MNDRLLRIYHRLPGPARTLAATGRGLYLRAWRYGRATEDLIARAREREDWPLDRWTAWQQERLAEVLESAARTVPYYRVAWQRRRAAGDRSASDRLENWPILEKQALRATPHAFVADGTPRRRLYHEHTSGTTGTPVDLFRPTSTVQELYALSELRERRWYGVSIRQPWAILGGQLIVPVTRREPPFWVWNRALNQLYMSSYHLSAANISWYLDALRDYGISYLWGYSSALHALAVEALRLGRHDAPMRVAITNAEPLLPEQRRTIADAFACPVRETYGMAELVMAASECEAGQLHAWPEVGVTEVHNADPSSGLGELVCTGLMNPAMPLIRYRTGDLGAMTAAGDPPCSCGRSLPRVSRVEGRADDVLLTTDGRRIGRLDPVFKTRLPVREAQIIQESLTRVRVRFVPAADSTPDAMDQVRTRLRDRLGPVDVVLECVDRIPRTAAGKFRAVICDVPLRERQAVGAA